MPSRPPNILLAFSDQQSARHGLLHLDAPHQDRLAREGTRFRAAYCVAPQCTPARAALLTGLYPHTTGVETNLGAAHAMPLSPRWPTFAVYLQQAGYQTAYFGKWHVHPELDPTAFGFDVAYCPAGHGKIDQPVTDRACAWLESARPPWLLV
ncbi:MAG TPA: sulfatase-like hydrolase/transferase, partial [Limnochordia bacterium]